MSKFHVGQLFKCVGESHIVPHCSSPIEVNPKLAPGSIIKLIEDSSSGYFIDAEIIKGGFVHVDSEELKECKKIMIHINSLTSNEFFRPLVVVKSE